MNETEQLTADSSAQVVDSAPQNAAVAAAVEAAEQPALVASEPVAQVKGKFDEQLALMQASDAAQVQAQLSMPHMDDSMVYKIVETHAGNHAVLYKTYEQAVLARDVRDSIENAAGHKVLPIAKAKLGSTYCKGEYSTEQGCKGEADTFGIGSLVEFQATGLIVVMVVIIGLTVLCYLMSFIMAKLGLNKTKAPAPAVKAAPASAAAAAPAAIGPAHCDWDPNAKSVHPGFTNKQLQAFLGIAAVAALEEHPGMTNDQFLALVTAAATQAIGQPCRVTAYRNINSPAWTIVK
jgi:hypothetical protein